MAAKAQIYSENGIALSKTTLYVGDEITLTYDGLLFKSGADKVFAYIGYGEQWEERAFIPMTYETDKFKAVINVALPGTFNLAFKDSAENWDNNSGQNYVFKVTNKRKAAAKATAKADGEEKPAAKAKAAKSTKTTKAAAKTTTKATAAKAKTTKKKKEE